MRIFKTAAPGVTLAALLSVNVTAFAENTLPNDFQSLQSLQSETHFFTGSLLFQGTGYFQTVNALLPKSYYANNIDYWGEYVCGRSDCSVMDDVFYDPYAVAPADASSVGGQLQEERVFTVNAADIYDAATWQIAIALAANKKISSDLSLKEAQVMIDNENLRLNKVTSRADTHFSYAYGESATQIENLKYAYGYRMLGQSYMVDDPFKGTGYDYLVQDTADVPQEQHKQVSWADWKPISGENGWAFLLGPVQASNLIANGAPVSTEDLGFNNALDFLFPLQRMQSPIGAFYYAMSGSDGNTGQPVPEGEISTENNASILAGLHVLQQTIQAIPGWQKNPRLSSANNVINIMLFGGELPQGGSTAGLLNYFKHDAWNATDGVFFQGGTYIDGTFSPTRTPFALDVNTWGVTAIGPQTVDTWFGAGAALSAWEKSRALAGYFDADGTLMGVGYTDQSQTSDKVLSGEWTAGAVTMVHMLINYYENHPGITADQMQALKNDQANMLKGLLRLRSDAFVPSDFPENGGAYPLTSNDLTTLAKDEMAVMYASNRYNIPFGWYANPLPSTASTAWTMMLSYWYNPFGFHGAMESPDFTAVPSYDPTKNQLQVAPNTVTVLNKLQDQTTFEYLLPLSISYNTQAAPNNWIPLGTVSNGSWVDILIPDVDAGAKTIGVAYQVDNVWYPACQLDLSNSDVQTALHGDPIHTAIVGNWVADPNNPSQGGGACAFVVSQ